MAKLLGDLPENWTMGQTISPNGTEVGLTEKHGYNYLMKQVNLAQKEVNNINTELEYVAKQETSEDILSKIGATDDTGGSQTAGTVMGKLNNVQELMTENISGNLTELVYPTTFINFVASEADSTHKRGTYDIDVLTGQTEEHVYIITVQGTSPYVANRGGSIAVRQITGNDTYKLIGTMSFGNNSSLDAQSAMRASFYLTATNIKLQFYLQVQLDRDYLSVDWIKVERLK